MDWKNKRQHANGIALDTYIWTAFDSLVARNECAVKVAADPSDHDVAVQLDFRDNRGLARFVVGQGLWFKDSDSAVLDRDFVRFFGVAHLDTEGTHSHTVLLREFVRKFLQMPQRHRDRDATRSVDSASNRAICSNAAVTHHIKARQWELGVVGFLGFERVWRREHELDLATLDDVAGRFVVARALVGLADQVETEPPLEALGRVGRVAAVELDVVELLHIELVAHRVVAHKVLEAYELDLLRRRRGALLWALDALSVWGRHGCEGDGMCALDLSLAMENAEWHEMAELWDGQHA